MKMPIFLENGTYFVTQLGFREPVQFPPSRVNILRLPNDFIQIRTKPRPTFEPPETVALDESDDSDDSVSIEPSKYKNNVTNGFPRKLPPKPAPKLPPKPAPELPPKPAPKLTPKQAPKLPPKPAPKLPPNPAPKLSPKPAPKLSPKPAPKLSPKPAPKLSPKPAPKLNSVIIKKPKHNDASVAAKPSGSSVEMSAQNKRRMASYEPGSIKSKLLKMFTKQPNSTPPVVPLLNEAFVMQGFKLNKPFVIPRKPKAPSVEREPSPASEDLPDFPTAPQLDSRADFRTPSPPVISFEGDTNSPIRLYVDNESSPTNMEALLASPHDVRNGDCVTSLVDDKSPQSPKSSSPPPEIPHVQKSGAVEEMPTDDLDVLDLFAEDEGDFDF